MPNGFQGTDGTLHAFTEDKSGFPIHWWKGPAAGATWEAENMNTPTPGGNPDTGPGLYDDFAGPGNAYTVTETP